MAGDMLKGERRYAVRMPLMFLPLALQNIAEEKTGSNVVVLTKR